MLISATITLKFLSIQRLIMTDSRPVAVDSNTSIHTDKDADTLDYLSVEDYDYKLPIA